jgi:hypothetical protein
MPMKKILAVSVAALAFALGVEAQTNLQLFYDFGKDRKHVTTTVEGFYNDKWGNTFFFIDHDYNSKTDADHVICPKRHILGDSPLPEFLAEHEVCSV